MSPIVKPDRPIWPPVPETSVPPQPQAPRPASEAPQPESQALPRSTKRDTALHEALLTEGDSKAGLSAFEGFGSFSG